MVIFKEKECLGKVNADPHLYEIVSRHINDLPGYTILIEEEDTIGEIDLPELKCRLERIPWEGVTRYSGYYHAVYLTNNEFALEFIIPDAPWLSAAARDNLESHAL